jgi:hypothetical protein
VQIRDERHKPDLGESPKRICRQVSTSRMAKIRLPGEQASKMRRKHGCTGRTETPIAYDANIVTTRFTPAVKMRCSFPHA